GFDALSGNQIWSRFLSSSKVMISNVHNGLIYAVSNNQYFAVNATTGQIPYNDGIGGVITSPPTLHNDKVIFGSHDTFIYALNISTGDVLWRYETGWGIDTSPVIYNNTVYIGSQDHNIYALDVDNGSLRWLYTCKGAIHSSLFVVDGYLVSGSDDGVLYILDASTGSLVYRFIPGYTINGTVNYLTTPILGGITGENRVVYTSNGGVVYALQL
ncbi:MAG: PQQ-binding-like beta-propeller repeat protein, partial [Candidatus Thermoplasmatota archaeon]